MFRGLLFIAYVALVVYCITDVLQSDDEQPHGLPRWGWVFIILLFPILGGATWLVLKYRRGGGGRNQGRPQVAPDDDPEYLSWLREQERRRRQQGGSDGPY